MAGIGAVAPIRTAGETVTDQLRAMITAGRVAPGQALNQDQLARAFGTSRVPVREALRQLSGEGLVFWRSHRSAVVTALAVAELEELFATAGALESLAVRRGVPRLMDSEVFRMGRLLDEMQGMVAAPPLPWHDLDLLFRMVPVRAAGWPRVRDQVAEIHANLRRYLYPAAGAAMPRDWHGLRDVQQRAVLEAAEARDGAAAAGLATLHWQEAWDCWKPELTMLVKAQATSE